MNYLIWVLGLIVAVVYGSGVGYVLGNDAADVALGADLGLVYALTLIYWQSRPEKTDT